MSPGSDISGDERWQSARYVESWIANRASETERRPLREKLVSLLPFEPESEIRILDVGAGTGALSFEVLRAFPDSRVVSLDFSTAMLDHARQNLADFVPRITFIQADLRDPAWFRSVDGIFDAVVSGFTFHTVPEGIQGLYREIFDLVAPGGCFMSVDNVTAPGPVTTELYRKARLAVHQANLIAETGREQSQEELERVRRERRSRHEHEYRYSLVEQLDWLKQAGFNEVDCLWKDMRRAIICGVRHEP